MYLTQTWISSLLFDLSRSLLKSSCTHFDAFFDNTHRCRFDRLQSSCGRIFLKNWLKPYLSSQWCLLIHRIHWLERLGLTHLTQILNPESSWDNDYFWVKIHSFNYLFLFFKSKHNGEIIDPAWFRTHILSQVALSFFWCFYSVNPSFEASQVFCSEEIMF